MKINLIITLLIFTYSTLFGQNEVKIGNQVWMTKNLDVGTFHNGEVIFQAKSDEEWKKACNSKTPAWCYYNYEDSNGEKYGKIYNYFAMSDSKGMAPLGWHIPTTDDWIELKKTIGENNKVAKKLKTIDGWEKDSLFYIEMSTDSTQKEVKKLVSVGENGTNVFNFSAKPGGYKDMFGFFDGIGKMALFWCYNTNSIYSLNSIKIHHTIGLEKLGVMNFDNSGDEGFGINYNGIGMSIRLISDSFPKAPQTKLFTALPKGLIKINNQTWDSKNLDVDTFRNGDKIPQVVDPIEWANIKTGAWCWYNNDSAKYAAVYGRLYNWYAVNDPRGLAPYGWHVATDADWNLFAKMIDKSVDTLTATWSGEKISMKIKSNMGWYNNCNGNNASGFKSMPSGSRSIRTIKENGTRSYSSSFYGIEMSSSWWTSTEYDINSAWMREVQSFDRIYRSDNKKNTGLSVRVVKN